MQTTKAAAEYILRRKKNTARTFEGIGTAQMNETVYRCDVSLQLKKSSGNLY